MLNVIGQFTKNIFRKSGAAGAARSANTGYYLGDRLAVSCDDNLLALRAFLYEFR